jgi:hypothetical protein
VVVGVGCTKAGGVQESFVAPALFPVWLHCKRFFHSNNSNQRAGRLFEIAHFKDNTSLKLLTSPEIRHVALFL